MAKNVSSKGVVRTIQDEYEGDKSNFDNYLKEGDKPKTPPKGVATETNNIGVNNDALEGPRMGAEDFDIDKAVFSMPEDLEDIEGSEGFMKKVKAGIERLLRMIKNFGIWLAELIFNKTAKIKNKLYNLKQSIRTQGPNFNMHARYPGSVIRLMTEPKVSSNPLWVNDNLAKIKVFFDDSLSGMNVLKEAAVGITSDFQEDQLLERVKGLAESYAETIKATTKENNAFIGELLGFKNIRVNIPNSPRLSETNVSLRLGNRPPIKLPELIPDITVVNKIIIQLDVMVNNLSKYHQSQSSAAREFEKQVRKLMDGTNYANKTSQANAKRFYTWLITFFHGSVSASLTYVYDALFAAVEFCYANLRSSK